MSEKSFAPPKTLFAFIWYFLKPFKFLVFMCAFLSFTAGFWGPFNNILIKNIIDLLPVVEGRNPSSLLVPASLIVLNFIIFDNITWRGITLIRAKVVPAVSTSVMAKMMKYVLGHSHQFFLDNLSGKISKEISILSDSIERLIGSIASNFLRGFSLLLTAFITAYYVNPIFGYILVIWFFIFGTFSIKMSKRLSLLSENQAKAESLVSGELVDTIANQTNIRIFAKKSFERNRIEPFFKEQRKAYRKAHLYGLLMHTIQGSLISLMMGFSAYFLVKLFAQGLVSVGDFALIFGLSMETGHMVWFTTTELDEFYKASGRAKQSLDSLIKPHQVDDILGAKELICSKGKIEFKNVVFDYYRATSFFKNKSIEILPGQKVGLVGYSGSGKSTFVNLILRLYDVQHGCITIDGQDISQVTQKSLHRNIGMIPQDPVLFQRTLLDNIHYGNEKATREQIVDAAKKAHAHDFISMLEEGYYSTVGERGIKLSGGQRQRIAIARAILKDAPILILDEATSQLDSVTESLIQESITQLMRNKTTIIIAHRLSTLLNMDRILVFDKGSIVEDGSHSELLKNGKLYATLWNAQVGGFLGDLSNISS